MKNKFILAICASLVMVLLVAGTVSAKPLPKVQICHFDKEANVFVLISVSQNAQQAHLNHGDVLWTEAAGANCENVTPGSGSVSPSKVAVCHWDKQAGVYTLINVSKNAVKAHFPKHTNDFLWTSAYNLNCVAVTTTP
jgi:hypothetical protein